MEIKGQVTILFSSEGLKIEVHDVEASTTFARIQLNQEQTCQALSRLSNTECEKMDVFGLERIGKRHECKTFEFEIIVGSDSKTREEAATLSAILLCPNGWEPDLYFGSQNSFFKKDGKDYARCTIRRWVQIS